MDGKSDSESTFDEEKNLPAPLFGVHLEDTVGDKAGKNTGESLTGVEGGDSL